MEIKKKTWNTPKGFKKQEKKEGEVKNKKMKLSFFILFIILILGITRFTKLNIWFNIKMWWILALFGLFCLLRFFEIHNENKKRNYLVNEIRGGY